VDESGAKTNLTRLYGRAEGGQRVVDAAPWGHWRTTTLIGALRRDGSTASLVLEGATDTESFQAYVDRVLVPSLRPGDIVVMDNLGAHHAPGVATAIEAVEAEVWYLPPYSPDLNPIEKMWSKVKQFLRSAKARSSEELFKAVAKALESITPADAIAFFNSCDYCYIQK
jgi:transposase